MAFSLGGGVLPKIQKKAVDLLSPCPLKLDNTTLAIINNLQGTLCVMDKEMCVCVGMIIINHSTDDLQIIYCCSLNSLNSFSTF